MGKEQKQQKNTKKKAAKTMKEKKAAKNLKKGKVQTKLFLSKRGSGPNPCGCCLV